MSNGSPSAYLLWALLSVFFFAFMLVHLWCYDKFKCLRWDSGRQPGAFKRVMTYSYFGTVPLLMVFAVAMAALKYKEGAFIVEDGTIIARPLSAWQDHHLRWILPLYFCLSIAWSLELVTHLEELTFWLFLLNQGPSKREWFHSWEFRAWYMGSMVAILGMPLTTLIKRHDLELCEAWIFSAGASASTFTTVCFLWVLANFPRFIRSVKVEGAVPDVVVRLSTFYHLNCIRVVFRFLFTVPLLTLGLDGLVDSRFRVVASPFWSDVLLMMGAIGCFISSAITLLIFFPRSMTSEAGYKAHAVSQHSKGRAEGTPLPNYERHASPLPSPKSVRSDHSSPQSHHAHGFQFPEVIHADAHLPTDAYEDAIPQHYSRRPPSGTRSEDTVWDGAGARRPAVTSSAQLSRHEHGSQPPMFVGSTPIYVEEVEHAPSPPYPLVHHYAMNFTSPIDLPEDPDS